jgi:hypothetical protein
MTQSCHTRLWSYIKTKFLNYLDMPVYQSPETDASLSSDAKEADNNELAHLKMCIESINGIQDTDVKEPASPKPDLNWSLPLEVRQERRRVASGRHNRAPTVVYMPSPGVTILETIELDLLHESFKDRCLTCSRPSPQIKCLRCKNWQFHDKMHYGVSISFGCIVAGLIWYFIRDTQITIVTGFFAVMISTLIYQTFIHPLERGV